MLYQYVLFRRFSIRINLIMKGGECVAEQKMPKNDFVDISSSADVEKVYHPEAAQRRTKKKFRWDNLALRITALVFSLIFCISGILVLHFWGKTGKYDNDLSYNVKKKSIPVASGDEASPDEIGSKNSYALEQDSSTLLQSESVLNILLVGQDFTGSTEEYGRSDTMILLSIDGAHNKIKLTSFQRDTLVYIPSYDADDKLNAAYSMGGVGLAIRTLEMNYGIKIDRYASVDFDAFRKIINILGGIDMDLNLEEIEYINAQIDVNHQLGRTSFLEYDETKEIQTMHLDGQQALWYARDRGADSLGGNPQYSFSGDDWDRTQRQRNLLQTLVKYLRSKADFGDLLDIINDVGPMVTTNLKKSEILFLVKNIMTILSYDMVQLSMPSEGTWSYGTTYDGQSVIVVDDWGKARYDLAYFVYEDALVMSE